MSSRHQAVLGIFFEEGVTTLSPAHLAYRMGVPVREAEALLDEMVTQDLLALDFSGDHDFGYRLPPGTLPPKPRQPHSPQTEASQAVLSQHPGRQRSSSPYAAEAQDGAYGVSSPAHYAAGSSHPAQAYGSAQRREAPPISYSASADGTDGSVGPIRTSGRGYAQPAHPHHRPTSSPSAPPAPFSNSPYSTAADAGRQELVPFRDNLPQQHVRPDRRPFVAGLLSFLFTGLGQVYNGEPLKGGLMFATSMMLWLFWMGWVVSMWSIADAYTVAQRAESQGA
ncbi:hypothetical protein FRC96_13605 [Lujinxingia vulgaris]|uniref:TM2 domain-containing protein n=1 Tax=Lujinxingia vulgaris TaxID=2600176 RepID=A0A5C6X0R3_9DELT|nr:hypothetical protein [Lujinxingia vulgaris]TXD34647.1 hypothetical protein FRC96_13605 [Lujinxingia vulgaris]